MSTTVNFNDMYQSLVDGKMTCQEASEIMKGSEVRKTVNAYLHKKQMNSLIPYFADDLQNIQGLINVTQFIYNDSGLDTGLSDSEYDTLYAIMLDNGGSDIISVPIAPDAVNIAHHKYPSLRGTLTKTHYLSLDEEKTNPSRKYLDEWIQTMENKIYQTSGRRVSLNEEDIYVFPKFDGVSGIFEMNEDGTINRVLTRGFTERNEAQDITRHFKRFPKRDFHEFNGPYGLKTEVMMYESDLANFNAKYHTDYKNTRSIVSGILNSDEFDPDKARYLHAIPLRVGNEAGDQQIAKEAFKSFPFLRCKLKDREAIRKFALAHRYINNELRCDGAVIYIINPELQKILGRENDKNNFEVAYKFTEESEMSTLKDVTFNMGLFGRLAPVAQVKPVKLKGNTIENISLGSIGRFKALNLRKGDKVKVLYDIIPYLAFDSDCEHNPDGKRFEIPTECPECGSELVFSESGDIASCVNPDCPCRKIGKILNYLSKMKIDGLSYGVITKLYHEGIVKDIADLYKLGKHKKEIVNIDGFGKKMLESWIDAINAKKEVPDYILLGAIGIEGVSHKTFERIMPYMDLEQLYYSAENKLYHTLVGIPTIREKTAIKIIEGIAANEKLLRKLEKELTIIPTKGNLEEPKFSACFTMIRDPDLEDWIREHDGKIDDSVTKKTTFLIVPSPDTQSSKVDKARKYGVRVVPIEKAKLVIEAELSLI